MKIINSFTLIAFALFILNACKKDVNLQPRDRGALIELTEKGHLTVDQIIQNVDELSVQGIATHGVTYYSLTYRTDYNGEAIDTKGLLMIPDNVDSAYLIGYFKGTQLPVKILDFYDSKLQTPSYYDGGKENFSEIRNMGLTWASAGYTVFMPDYTGYGSTIDREHPYMYYPEMFKANIDGLLAAKSVIADKGLKYDNRIFLGGWSQGGGACLSAHKYIQENYATQFTVVASSGLSGPYHFSRFIDEILANENKESRISNIFSWSIYAMNKFSEVHRPTDQLYAYPVFDQYAAIFPPSKKPSEILNAYFLSKILDGTDTAFRTLLDRNTFSAGWTPVGKVFLHHGAADDIVPYFNSLDAKNGLTAAGGDVTLYTYPGGTHDSELDKYITNTLNDFNLLK